MLNIYKTSADSLIIKMTEEKEKISLLVTGASSGMGLSFIKQFHQKYEFTGSYNKNKPNEEIFKKIIKWDLTQDSAPAIEEDIDFVLHYAALSEVEECEENKEKAIDINVVGTLKVLELARKKKVNKFIFISTGSVYKPNDKPNKISDSKEPLTFYGLSKSLAEDLCRGYSKHFKVIIVRPFSIYGPGTKPTRLVNSLIERVKSGRILLNNQNKPKINPCYIDDFNSSIESLLSKEERQYSEFNIGGPEELDIKQISELIGSLIGERPAFEGTGKEASNSLSDNSEIDKIYSAQTGVKEGIKKQLGFMES